MVIVEPGLIFIFGNNVASVSLSARLVIKRVVPIIILSESRMLNLIVS